MRSVGRRRKTIIAFTDVRPRMRPLRRGVGALLPNAMIA